MFLLFVLAGGAISPDVGGFASIGIFLISYFVGALYTIRGVMAMVVLFVGGVRAAATGVLAAFPVANLASWVSCVAMAGAFFSPVWFLGQRGSWGDSDGAAFGVSAY